MDLIREIELEGGGYAEVSASGTGHMTEPVRLRIHSPGPGRTGTYLTAGECLELAVTLIMAGDRAEGRALADATGPVAIIDAIGRELYHGDRKPSLLHQHTAAAISSILATR